MSSSECYSHLQLYIQGDCHSARVTRISSQVDSLIHEIRLTFIFQGDVKVVLHFFHSPVFAVGKGSFGLLFPTPDPCHFTSPINLAQRSYILIF